ncbi:MAG: beta-lactamase family protein, partial [Saprospiraceae bacterium]|nr:beta-lactamase family protein [Saprospiraceae bacterium]
MKRSLLLILLLVSYYNVLTQVVNHSEFSELKEKLHKKFADKFDFSVLVDRNDSIVIYKNIGHRDKGNLNPIDEKTIFNIASITKSITAAGIFKLIEENKLKLSHNLEYFFEDVPNSKKSITIKTLLSHKSGLRQTYPLDGISDSNKALDKIFDEDLEFDPDSGFRYSNQNYQLLALIIEKVTGNSYESYIKENVLIPLDMENSFFWDEASTYHNIAPIDEGVLDRNGRRNWGYIGSGGIFTTTNDLLEFWNGIYKKGFLTEKSIVTIFDNYFETSSGIQIGLGFFLSPDTKWNLLELWTRGTESWGHNSVIRHFPEKDVTIIVSTNSGEIDNDSSRT